MALVTDIFQSSLETRNLRSISSEFTSMDLDRFAGHSDSYFAPSSGVASMSAYRELVIRRDYPCRPACQVPVQVPAEPNPRQTPVP